MPFLHQGDIVFAYFPFEEDNSIVKKRPCLVLAIDDNNKRFLAAKITTTRLNHSWAVHLNKGNADLASGYLKIESWINLNRREQIPFSDYIFTIGTLKHEIMQSIIEKIISQRKCLLWLMFSTLLNIYSKLAAECLP